MKPEYRSLGEFINKVEWEGGILDALDYGLSYEELDPEDPVNQEFRSVWQQLQYNFGNLKDDIRKLENFMEDYESDEATDETL